MQGFIPRKRWNAAATGRAGLLGEGLGHVLVSKPTNSTFRAWRLSRSTRQLGSPLSTEISKVGDPQYWCRRAEEASPPPLSRFRASARSLGARVCKLRACKRGGIRHRRKE